MNARHLEMKCQKPEWLPLSQPHRLSAPTLAAEENRLPTCPEAVQNAQVVFINNAHK